MWVPPGGAVCSAGSVLHAAAEMCGLAGLVDPSGGRTAEELHELARAMANRLVHRGPDDHGSWADPAVGVALGHRRLSIVDLSEAGHQPMVSADGRWVLAYNGELYNTPELRNSVGLGARDLRGHSDSITEGITVTPGEGASVTSTKTGLHGHGVLSIDEGLVAMLRDTRELLEKVAADLGEDVPSDAYVFSSDPLHRTPINPDTLRNRLPSIFSAS